MTLGIEDIPIKMLTHILDNVGVGIVIDNAAGEVIWANEAHARITGVDVRKYIGRSVWEVRNDPDIEYISLTGSLFEAAVRAGKSVHNVLKYKTADRIINTTTPIYAENGVLEYVVCTLINFSQANEVQQVLASAFAKIDALEGRLAEMQSFRKNSRGDIVVEDEEMRKLYRMAFKLSQSTIPIMLLGETGVGKDVLAKYIHEVSDRKEMPFVHVNMGAIPTELFESELFGYEAGAFTGASKKGRPGLIWLANGGTLFLDEVGEIPLNVQTKLLQVIQEKTVRRVGGLTEAPIDIKIISATNRSLEEMIERGEFRLDLFYRLNVAELRLPPLRERPNDVPMLIQTFLKRYNERYHCEKTLSPETLQQLLQYSWPGNIRELRHTIESLVVLSSDAVIEPQYLPAEIRSGRAGEETRLRHGSLKATLEGMERQLIKEAISNSRTLAAAAASLDIDASTLAKKRKKYGI